MTIFLIKGKLCYFGNHSCYLLIKLAKNNLQFLSNNLGMSKVRKVLEVIKKFVKASKFKVNYVFTEKIIGVNTFFLESNNFGKRYLNFALLYLLNEICVYWSNLYLKNKGKFEDE